jgi:hypothetical protein
MDLINLLAIVGTALASIHLLYLALLPKPIRGIPYNESSSKSLRGDIPALTTHLSINPTGTFTTYAASLMRKLNSPLIQVFTSPLSKPTLILGDYAESYNVFVRRTREFDRSPTIGYMLLGFIPENHIHLRTNDKWKAQRRLLLGAMNAAFIYGVLGDVIEERVAGLVELWRVKSRVAAGRPWSAAGDLYLLALGGGSWRLLFGGHFGPGAVGVEEMEGSGEMAAEASEGVRRSETYPLTFRSRL